MLKFPNPFKVGDVVARTSPPHLVREGLHVVKLGEYCGMPTIFIAEYAAGGPRTDDGERIAIGDDGHDDGVFVLRSRTGKGGVAFKAFNT